MRSGAVANRVAVAAIATWLLPMDGMAAGKSSKVVGLPPSTVTAMIASCTDARLASEVAASVQLASCACMADYVSALKPDEERRLKAGLRTGALPTSFIKAMQRCAQWADERDDVPLDRTPYSRKNVLSAIKVMEAFLDCTGASSVRAAVAPETIERCNRTVSAMRPREPLSRR